MRAVNGKLKCADNVALFITIPAGRPVSDGYGFLFSIIILSPISLVPQAICGLFFRMLLVLFSRIFPLDGPNIMPDPTPPLYTTHEYAVRSFS